MRTTTEVLSVASGFLAMSEYCRNTEPYLAATYMIAHDCLVWSVGASDINPLAAEALEHLLSVTESIAKE